MVGDVLHTPLVTPHRTAALQITTTVDTVYLVAIFCWLMIFSLHMKDQQAVDVTGR